MQERADRLPYLDGLRGVAALAVVIFHMNGFNSVLLWHEGVFDLPRVILGRITNGNFAVCIFFALSGYVLASPFTARSFPNWRLGDAAVRRYFRLTPVAFFAVLLSFLVWTTYGYHTKDIAALGPGFAWMANTYSSPPTFSGALYNGLFGVYASDNSYVGTLWTIAIELWGSLFLFAVLALFPVKQAFVRVALILVAVLVGFFGSNGIYISLFLVGSIFSFEKRLAGPWYLLLPAVYLGSLDQWSPDLAALAAFAKFSWSTYAATNISHAIAAALLLSAVLGSPFLQKFFSVPPVLWLGRVSFSLYAVHIIVIFSVGNGVFIAMTGLGHDRLAALCAILSVLACSFSLAVAFHRLIDVPSQRLAKAIAPRILGRRSFDGSNSREATSSKTSHH